MKDERGRTVLRLEGRLTDSWVDEVSRAATVVATNAVGQVSFDLKGLSFADGWWTGALAGSRRRRLFS